MPTASISARQASPRAPASDAATSLPSASPAGQTNDPAADPPSALEAFIAALAAAELRLAAACFTRDACLVTSGGTAVHGREQIRPLLAQLIAAHTTIEISELVVRRAGNLALAEARWSFRSEDPGPAAHLVQVARPTVALREVEQTWKIAIAAPWQPAELAR